MKFYSRPGELLNQHLNSVANNIKLKISSTYFNENINKEYLSKIGFLTGLSHDFGKYTTFFQKWVLTGIKSDGKENHGLISALFSFFIIQCYLKDNNLNENNYYKFLPLIAFQIVKHHHGNLNDLSKDVQINNIELLKEQVINIKQSNIVEFKTVYNGIEFDVFYNLFHSSGNEINYKTIIEDELEKMAYIYNSLETNEELKNYYFIVNQYLYSLLISYDKMTASGADIIKRTAINFDIVNKYKKDKYKIDGDYINKIFKKDITQLSLDEMREKIYQEVLNKIDKVSLDNNKIFTLTAPTGSGKTLASFAVAFKIKEKLKNIQNPRIIYSLPFTSIIEQNFDVLEKILKKEIQDYKRNKNLYLIKHHYFANIEYKKANELQAIEKSLLYIENWDSEIIITTFIQMFHTLIGYKNRFLKKFHNITNSVIILDEIQNIPVKYWKIINFVLKMLSQYFNCYVLLLTATRPLIFSDKESTELLENNIEYFKNLNRTKIKVKIKQLKSLKDIRKNIKKIDRNKIMIVLNTIQSTVDLFKEIDNDKFLKSYRKIYLSTNITPFERKRRIDYIIKIKKDEKIIIVTTQLIEAGVDIDVDIIFRDLAPMDSIIQCCGRINRNNLHKSGELILMELEDSSNSRFLWKYIYDSISVNECTIKAFGTKKEITESNFLKYINTYFNLINEKKTKAQSEKLIKSINSFYFYDVDPDKQIPISNFKLIEEMPYYVSLFVELDKTAKNIWNQYETGILKIDKNIKDWQFQAKNYFASIKGEFYKYIINIPRDLINGVCQEIKADLYYLSLENINNNGNLIYDSKNLSGIGYNRKLKEWFI